MNRPRKVLFLFLKQEAMPILEPFLHDLLLLPLEMLLGDALDAAAGTHLLQRLEAATRLRHGLRHLGGHLHLFLTSNRESLEEEEIRLTFLELKA